MLFGVALHAPMAYDLLLQGLLSAREEVLTDSGRNREGLHGNAGATRIRGSMQAAMRL